MASPDTALPHRTASAAFDASPAQIRAALDTADIPTLLAALYTLTGDDRWLREPYQVRFDPRAWGGEDGGLDPQHQAQVRAAAAEVLEDIRHRPLTIREPSLEELERIMSWCTGAPVGAEYAGMMLEEMGFRGRDAAWTTPDPPARASAFDVVVIGAGVSGLLAAIKLDQLGVPFTVIEKNDDVGGTWLENRYPGCGVDTPNHFYSYSFEPNHDWPAYYSKRDELHAYLARCSERYAVRDRIRFSTTVLSATWDDADRRWVVTVTDGDGRTDVLHASAVITAVGLLNRPSVPAIEGLEQFAGPAFHTAAWPDGIDLTGKRVAVIGSGASAMQVVPTIAGTPSQLTIYQRSSQWVLPNGDYHRQVPEGTKWLLRHLPTYAAWYRFRLFWKFGDGVHASLHIDPTWIDPERSINRVNDRFRELLTAHIRASIGERADLLDKVVPDYPPFGKRMLIDNGWFDTLRRDDVELVVEAIEQVTADGIVTADGTTRDHDVVVLATGFHASEFLAPMAITGRGGRDLRDEWAEDDPRALYGVTIPDFPNLFVLYGPNTNLAHGGSAIFHAECQVRYVTALIVEMIEREIAAVSVKRSVHDDYNQRVDEAHDGMVWSHPRMSSWYRNDKGRVVTNSPWRMIDYWEMTRVPDLDDFEVDRR